MIPILLYSHIEEPITKVLFNSNLCKKMGLIKISLKKILDEACIIDEFDEEEVKIDWKFACGLKITNSSNFYLINRVMGIPEEIFYDFSEEDRKYAISEFRAYLAFAIEAFPNAFSKPGAFGLSGNRFSLPRQWEIIKNSKNPLTTPNYYLGNMSFCSLKENLIYKNPFDFYYWKPNENLIDISKASFVFVKPKGKAVIGFVVGNETEIFCYENSDSISVKMTINLQENSLRLARLFNYSVAEILFFVEEDKITFGMISCIPYASNKKNWFFEKISSYFDKKLEEKHGTS